MLGGFRDRAQWLPLREDPGLNRLTDNQFPGALLLRLGFGRLEDATAPEVVREWREDVVRMQQRELFEVRVHIYQARNLPASDADGSLDPYFKVLFNGEREQRTSTKADTTAPLYYESVSFRAELPPDDDGRWEHTTHYTIHYTLYTIHCTLYTVHSPLYTTHCTHCTHCTLY
jgi:hypothetical protein